MVKVIVGLMGSSVATGSSKMSTPEQLRSFLSMLSKHNIHELDTARVYNGGSSEELLGQVSDAVREQRFSIATKAPGFSPGSLTHDKILRNCRASLVALKRDKIDVYYFHGPDRQTPLEESCRAINELYAEGVFERFGVSNFNVDEVTEIVAICREKGWVAPSVYQGVYNPLMRGMEADLLPALRKYGMAFYAYSPLGGGFFSRPTEELRVPPKGGRMDLMKHFQSIYVNELSLELLTLLTEACEKEASSLGEGCSTAGENKLTVREATLRWLMHHSALGEADGIVLGGSSEVQMEGNLKAAEAGVLPEGVVRAFEKMGRRYREGGGEGAGMYCV